MSTSVYTCSGQMAQKANWNYALLVFPPQTAVEFRLSCPTAE